MQRSEDLIPGDYSIRPATAADADKVAALVKDAYGQYVERIGRPPGPMTEDYQEVIGKRQVTVAESGEAMVGVIVLGATQVGFAVDNVAVHPSHRGRGLGGGLLQLAEAGARRAGFDSIYLYTHEKMIENLALYARIGYIEFERRPQGGFSLVFMSKRLSED